MKYTVFLCLLVAPATGQAQALSCAVPEVLADVPLQSPPVAEIVQTPVTGYVLSLSWSPQYCRDKGRSPEDAAQCGPQGRYGFILHGLWPEGTRTKNPAWCGTAAALPKDLVIQHFCMTPSAQLLQHEWAKHGTCITTTPDRYFHVSSTLYRAIRFPDMEGLSRQTLTIAGFAEAFVRANRGITPAMLRVQTSAGWLTEVQLCLDKDFNPRACSSGLSAAARRTTLRIWPTAPAPRP